MAQSAPRRHPTPACAAAVAVGAAVVAVLLVTGRSSSPTAAVASGAPVGADSPTNPAPHPPPPHPDPGDLVRVTASPLLVGFLLDDFPHAGGVRARIASDVSKRGDAWWRARALRQLQLTQYQLTYLTGEQCVRVRDVAGAAHVCSAASLRSTTGQRNP